MKSVIKLSLYPERNLIIQPNQEIIVPIRIRIQINKDYKGEIKINPKLNHRSDIFISSKEVFIYSTELKGKIFFNIKNLGNVELNIPYDVEIGKLVIYPKES